MTLQLTAERTLHPLALGTATAISNCSTDSVVTFNDTVEATCGATQIITRTWTAQDAC